MGKHHDPSFVTQAARYARFLTYEEARNGFVHERIGYGRGVPISVLENMEEERPEEVVAALIKNPSKVTACVYHGMIDGLGDLLFSLGCYLQEMVHKLEPPNPNWVATSNRLAFVLDIAAPPELDIAAHVHLTLTRAISGDDKQFLQDAVVMCCGYNQHRCDRGLWETLLREEPTVAAYAFNNILDLCDPALDLEAIRGNLRFLWAKCYQHCWEVDVPFLMRRAAREMACPELVQDVLKELHANDITDVYQKFIRDVLGEREWSKAWLDEFDRRRMHHEN